MLLKDDSPMPFGKHKGTEMANVPAKYLLWLYGEYGSSKPFGEEAKAVKTYILNNLEAIRKEADQEQAYRDCDATESDLY